MCVMRNTCLSDLMSLSDAPLISSVITMMTLSSGILLDSHRKFGKVIRA